MISNVIRSILANMNPQKYPINKPIMLAGIGFIILFILLIITKSFLPDTGGGWSDPPILDYLFIFGFGVCFSILSIGYSYFAWILTEEEYIQWYTDQQRFGKKLINSWRRVYPSGTVIWTNRLVAPVGALMGLFMIGFALFSIFKFIFHQ